MTSGPIGKDWRVDFSTVHGAQREGLTRVVFYDPTYPDRCCAMEFFLDGFVLEDLWWNSLSEWTYQKVSQAEIEARHGELQKNYQLTTDMKQL